MSRNKALLDLALEYLSQFGTVTHDLSLYNGPKKHSISFLLIVQGLLVGVWVLDWKCSVGTKKIIHIEQIIQRSNLHGGFIVANSFSANAKELAKSTKTLELIARAEILYQG